MSDPRPSQQETVSVPPAIPDLETLRRAVRIEVDPRSGEASAPAVDFERIVIRVPESGAPSPGPSLPARRGASDRYSIEHELGRGGMGVVYRAIDRDLKRPVAMKVLLSSAGAGTELAARFVEEAQATAQLQHPGIVPVYEIGVDADDRLFFTMKLVRGRTLAAVVEDARAGKTPDATLFRLLQIFVEVARTVAYAHARSVIHRDLKPHNIMIGGHGEVHVMDWGLAKVVTETRAASDAEKARVSEERRARRESRGDSKGDVETDSDRTPTEFGVLMGTPSYMPPEQARGHTGQVGPLSDVYALGATLYHILTGRPPFRGTTTAEIVERVVHAPPDRPRAIDRGVPAEVEAICLRALAKSPADRYPGADALADDVQRYLEGRPVSAFREGWVRRAGKLARRHRNVTATLGLAVVTGVVLLAVALVRESGLRDAAERSHDASERYRARAEDLSDFMLFDLQARLQTLGRLDLLGTVARKAREMYADLPADAPPEVRRKRAITFNIVGDVLEAEGDAALARSSYESASADFEKLLEASPRSLDLARGWLDARLGVIGTLVSQGQVAREEEECRRALATSAAWGEEARRDPGIRRGRATAERAIAKILLDRRDLEGALAAVDQAGIEAEAGPADHARELELSVIAADLRGCRADILEAMGDRDGALASALAALQACTPLYERAPDDDLLQDALFAQRLRLAELEQRRGALPAATQHARAATALAEHIVEWSPSSTTWRDRLATAHNVTGRILRRSGDTAGSLAEHRAALALLEHLVEHDPSNRAWQVGLATIRDHVGRALLTGAGDAAGALEQFRAALAIRQRLVSADPSSVQAKLYLAESRQNVAEALLEHGELPAAAEEIAAGLSIVTDLVRAGAAVDEAERQEGVLYDVLVRVQAQQKADSLAIATMRSACAVLDHVLSRRPTDPMTLYDAACAHQTLGLGLLYLGQAVSATAELAQAAELGRAAAARDAGFGPGLETTLLKLHEARVTTGELPPETPAEHLIVAYARYGKKEYVASAEAFERAISDAGIRAKSDGIHIYTAACAAALAGAGTDEPARRWRAKAIEWLRDHLTIRKARLDAIAREAAAGPSADRAAELKAAREDIVSGFESARVEDADFASIRGEPEFGPLFTGLPRE